jgi:cytochrome c oxidase subunit I
MDPEAMSRFLTYHGIIMVFMVIVPLIPTVLGNFLLPMQLGARNMAFPTLTRCSFRWYAAGSILVLVSLATCAVGTGWTFTTPYSLVDGGAFGVMALGLFLVAASWAATGINFIVTVHHKRVQGMGFFGMPILSWSMYLTGYILAVTGLLFGIIILYLAAATVFGKGLFSGGANPLDWQNYFWFVTTPAAFFALLPAAGVISEVIAGISRKAVSGYRTTVFALIALLGLSFISWGSQMIGSGQDAATSFTFAALAMLGVVPVALITYSWLSTLHRGSIACSAPTALVLGFMLNAGIGTVMALFLNNLSVGSYLSATLFKTAQIHYLMVGGVITAFLAGLHFWWTKMTGTQYDQLKGRVSAMLFTIGLNLAFFPQIIMGTKGAAPGVHDYPADLLSLQVVSTVGMVVMIVGLLVIVWNLVSAYTNPGSAKNRNPWGAATLEWMAESPPVEENFSSAPEFIDPY